MIIFELWVLKLILNFRRIFRIFLMPTPQNLPKIRQKLRSAPEVKKLQNCKTFSPREGILIFGGLSSILWAGHRQNPQKIRKMLESLPVSWNFEVKITTKMQITSRNHDVCAFYRHKLKAAAPNPAILGKAVARQPIKNKVKF